MPMKSPLSIHVAEPALLASSRSLERMNVNLNALGIIGTILFWLGIMICVGSALLYFSISKGISDGDKGQHIDATGVLHFHHMDYFYLGGKDKLIYLLPATAGILLISSGVLIRAKNAELYEVLRDVQSKAGSYESDAD